MKFLKLGSLLVATLIISLVVGVSPMNAEEVELSGKDLKAKTVAEVAALYGIDPTQFAEKISEEIKVKVKTTDYFQLLADNYGAETSTVKDIAANLQAESGATVTAKEVAPETVSKVMTPDKEYNFFPISIGLLLAYILSFVLSRFKVISYMFHKKIWNWLLLGFFLASAVLGSLLVLRISNGIVIPLPFNMLYWHVEAGVALTAISIFHIVWHWRYFVTVYKKKI